MSKGFDAVSFQRERVRLRAEQETLLITLYAKTENVPGGIFYDRKALEIREQIDYDFGALHVPMGTRLTLCLRASKLDETARKFLERQPQGMVIHLGCGLDSRFERVDNGKVEWYDLDLPDVIELRGKFFTETGRYHMIPASVTDHDWFNRIPAQDGAVLIIAEGLMMYLPEQEVKALVLKLHEEYPGCTLAFDAYSTQVVRRITAHPSIQRTGAVIQWGIDEPTELESWADGMRFSEEWFFTQAREIERLGFGYRLMFKISGLFPAARKAHRILFYTL
jgi:O-methyltransferase involved in polyketide biosynthesis